MVDVILLDGLLLDFLLDYIFNLDIGEIFFFLSIGFFGDCSVLVIVKVINEFVIVGGEFYVEEMVLIWFLIVKDDCDDGFLVLIDNFY